MSSIIIKKATTDKFSSFSKEEFQAFYKEVLQAFSNKGLSLRFKEKSCLSGDEYLCNQISFDDKSNIPTFILRKVTLLNPSDALIDAFGIEVEKRKNVYELYNEFKLISTVGDII